MEYGPSRFKMTTKLIIEEQMFKRNLKISKTRSFFLFGARGTGKSTWLRTQKIFNKKTLTIDLLEPELEEKYALNPQRLLEELKGNPLKLSWVVLDEVQKVPKLLDVVHKLIETTNLKFALTGSSSRKLKRAGANLLAGRAIRHFLFPLTHAEQGDQFDLESQLNWGSLPEVINLKKPSERALYLKTYYESYIKEEIVAEQMVRNLNPFRLFLPICIQNEGEPLNFSKMASATGVDSKTIQNYYEILIDTHLGFFLNSFDRSVRVAQREAAKFYFFDSGVSRAVSRQLTIPLQKRSGEWGRHFESWFINECFRLNEYNQLDYKFSYLRTKDGAEIDLIIERPDKSVTLVEIKSTNRIEDRHLKHLKSFKKDFPEANYVCISDEKVPRIYQGILITSWMSGLRKLGLLV